jgi:hypothetical protein
MGGEHEEARKNRRNSGSEHEEARKNRLERGSENMEARGRISLLVLRRIGAENASIEEGQSAIRSHWWATSTCRDVSSMFETEKLVPDEPIAELKTPKSLALSRC